MENIYEISNGECFFLGVKVNSDETPTKLIIPDSYNGIPITRIITTKIQSAVENGEAVAPASVDSITDIVVGNNVSLMIISHSNLFCGVGVERIYIGGKLSSIMCSDKNYLVGKSTKDIYFNSEISDSIKNKFPTEYTYTNDEGTDITNSISYHFGTLNLKYESSGCEATQSDYEENNPAYTSYIKNRPFYDERKYEDIEGADIISFATNETLADSMIFYVKVAELPDSPKNLINEIEYISYGDDKSTTYTAFGSGSFDFGNTFLIDEEDSRTSFSSEDIGFGGETVFGAAGLYALYYLRAGLKAVKIKFKGQFKQIDNKFLHIDKVPTEESANLITSGSVYQINSEVADLKDKIKSANSDYSENNKESTSYILNRPFYEEEIYEGNTIYSLSYSDYNIFVDNGQDTVVVYGENDQYGERKNCTTKFVKIADISPACISFYGSKEKAARKIIKHIREVDGGTLTYKDEYSCQHYPDNVRLIGDYNNIVCCYDAKADNKFSSEGIYVLAYEIDDDADDSLHFTASKISFDKIIHEIDKKFLPSDFVSQVENNTTEIESVRTQHSSSLSELRTDVSKINTTLTSMDKNIQELRAENNIIVCEDLPEIGDVIGDVIFLKRDVDGSIGTLDVEISEGNLENIAPTLNNVGVQLSKSYIDDVYKISWAVYEEFTDSYGISDDGSQRVDSGIFICDKDKKNGFKCSFTNKIFPSSYFDQICVVLAKVENGTDTLTYYCLPEACILGENEDIELDAGFYKIVDGTYTSLSEEEVNSFSINLDEAYISDYWSVMDEESINDALKSNTITGSPELAIRLLKGLATADVKQGFYLLNSSSNDRFGYWSPYLPSSNNEYNKSEIVNAVLEELPKWNGGTY